MNNVLRFALLLTAFSSLTAFAVGNSNITGAVAVWNFHAPKAVQMPLPTTDGALRNELVNFENLPANTFPDVTGCFCFEIHDERFAYVQIFYYANKFLEDYNELLNKMGAEEVKGITFVLTKDASMPTSGSASGNKVNLTYNDPAIDPFLIAHELGHILDYSLRERPDTNADFDWRAMAEESGVSEGAANLLAALHLRQPGNLLLTDNTLDAPSINIDTFVRFPDLAISRRKVLEQLMRSTQFMNAYPDFSREIRTTIDDPEIAEYLAQPDEYQSSAIINQPIWKSVFDVGVKKIKRIYLSALSDFSGAANYDNFAGHLVKVTKDAGERELGKRLLSEYRLRGLLKE